MDQEEVRQLSNQTLDLSMISPAAAFEVAHPRTELAVPRVLRAQNVALESISEQVLLRGEVAIFSGSASRPTSV